MANFQRKYKFANPAAIRSVTKWRQAVEDIEKKLAVIESERVKEYGIGYEWLFPSKVAFVVSV